MVQHALNVLTDDPNRIKPFLTDAYPPFIGVAFGFGAVCFVNAASRRPMMSGIQKHVIVSAIGGFIGKTVDGWRNNWMAERDAVLRHYVETHPDDFPDPEIKTFGQLLEPWVPIR